MDVFHTLAPYVDPLPQPIPERLISQLKVEPQGYMASSLAVSSQKAYSSGEKRFIDFCYKLHRNPNHILPTNENMLVYFSTYMAHSVRAGTIKVYLSAIRYMHKVNGHNLDLKSFLHLQYILKGIKRSQGSSKFTQLPITLTHLTLFQLLLSNLSFDNIMLWAALTLAFSGFLRVSEFTCTGQFNPNIHITLKDITFLPSKHNPMNMQIHLKVSKTDPFRSGVTLSIGRTGSHICPVTAMTRYISILSLNLFRTESGKPLTRRVFTFLTRDLSRTMGVNAKHYASHSFRIGAATSAGAANMPPWLIKTLGRWTSDCYERYIKRQ